MTDDARPVQAHIDTERNLVSAVLHRFTDCSRRHALNTPAYAYHGRAQFLRSWRQHAPRMRVFAIGSCSETSGPIEPISREGGGKERKRGWGKTPIEVELGARV